jgi:hypothetical protein
VGRVPKISQFYGIAIYMYYRDHLPPRFHAIYADHEAEIGIASGELVDGELPPSARRLVRVWADTHRAQLEANWHRARLGLACLPIEPLE